MYCPNELCPVVTPKSGLCEDCAIEQLEDKGYSFAEALKIVKIIYGE